MAPRRRTPTSDLASRSGRRLAPHPDETYASLTATAGARQPLLPAFCFCGSFGWLTGSLRLRLALALDDDLAEVFGLLADELLDQFPVHLLVLDRQGVRIGVELDDDVLLAGVRDRGGA